ncbi:phosphatase PAP2 family protein [Lentilactobacillus fungorum]|jgi:undecaprenyl-diphosphatase|nr:phosphatase PAP2 family protein [Lentilactobacillus fungorum]
MHSPSSYWAKVSVSTSFIIFLLLAIAVKRHQAWIQSFDQFFGRPIRAMATPALTHFFVNFTKLGNMVPLTVLVIVACLTLFFAGNPVASLFLLTNGLLLAMPINSLAKLLINRPRPTLRHLVTVHSSSFPSGHAMGTMMVFGSLIMIVNHLLKNNAKKLMLDLLFLVIIVLIGISRIYVGVHFASDVAGGWSLGFCLLGMSKFVFNKFIGGAS